MAVYELSGVRPALGRDVFVAESASVIGDVHLGDEASVWFGAVLRGDYFPIRVGARTNIQDNCVVHITADRAATTVGDDVTVGHGVTLHGCTVGDRCLVGMGSIVLDGAVLGEESLRRSRIARHTGHGDPGPQLRHGEPRAREAPGVGRRSGVDPQRGERLRRLRSRLPRRPTARRPPVARRARRPSARGRCARPRRATGR